MTTLAIPQCLDRATALIEQRQFVFLGSFFFSFFFFYLFVFVCFVFFRYLITYKGTFGVN